MGVSVEVDSATFATEVLEASYQKPVLVDFFAQWCGPCKMLKPMLEALAQEYDFVLAKIDIDQSPDLAHTYKVEGVPDVRVVTQGDVNPGFVGVLPEPQLREFLRNLSLKSELDLGLEAVKAAIASSPKSSSDLKLRLDKNSRSCGSGKTPTNPGLTAPWVTTRTSGTPSTL